MTTALGSIVHYKLSAQDARIVSDALPASVNGRYRRNSVNRGDIFPAIVVRDNFGDSCNLQVFLDGDCAYWATSRHEGSNEGEYQTGVA